MISESVFRQESICEPGSDILPKSKDIRTKFGYERVIRHSPKTKKAR